MPKERSQVEVDIFEKLEKFSKNKIPECIKSILKFAAFDTACSLSSLDEAAISSIENYVDQSEKSIINQLVCCNADKYQGQSHFHFLPGHRTILRSIPELIKQMKQSKKKPYKKLSDFQKLLSPQELKDLLLNRLNQHNFAKQGGLFTETHIEQITTMISNNTMSAKCDVKCLSCEASVPIVYNGSWGTSNVFRHLKAHYKNSGKGIDKLQDVVSKTNTAESTSSTNAVEITSSLAQMASTNAHQIMNSARTSSKNISRNMFGDESSDSTISNVIQTQDGQSYEEVLVEYISEDESFYDSSFTDNNNKNMKSVALESGQVIKFKMNVQQGKPRDSI